MDPNNSIDYSAWQFWLLVVSTLTGVFAWVSNRLNAKQADIDKVKEDVSSIDSRVTKVEASAISHEDLGKVYECINEVSGQVSELTGTTNGIKGGVDMIHQHLLSNGGNKE